MEMTEYHKFIQEAYNWARYKGICRTKIEFAGIIGVNPSTISATNQRRYSGKSTAKKVKAWLEQYKNMFDDIPQEVPHIITAKEMMIPKFDWDVFRAEASVRILSGLVMNEVTNAFNRNGFHPEPLVKNAIDIADELIKQLKDHE